MGAAKQKQFTSLSRRQQTPKTPFASRPRYHFHHHMIGWWNVSDSASHQPVWKLLLGIEIQKFKEEEKIKPDPAFGVVGELSNMLWIHRLVHLWDPWLLPDKDFYQKNQNQISIEIWTRGWKDFVFFFKWNLLTRKEEESSKLNSGGRRLNARNCKINFRGSGVLTCQSMWSTSNIRCNTEKPNIEIWLVVKLRDVLSKLAMASNWKRLVSSSNPTGSALVVWPGILPEQSW